MSQDTITPEPIVPVAAEAAQAEEVYEDYWGTGEVHRYMLPDGKQFFEIVPMNEGAKTRFQKLTNKGIRMNQRTQDAHLDVDPGGERHTLIKESVTGWFIMQKHTDGTFSEFICPQADNLRARALDQLLERFSPKAIQDLEHFIRIKNPWMQADMTVEEIDKEIERLYELRKQVSESEAGEDSSASK